MVASSFKPQPSSSQKLFISCLVILSFSLFLLVFSFKPKRFCNNLGPKVNIVTPRRFPRAITTPKTNVNLSLLSSSHHNLILDLIRDRLDDRFRRIKVGLVNVDDSLGRDQYEGISTMQGLVETVHVLFDPVNTTWEELFPEWIDEDQKRGPRRCPVIPMPKAGANYDDLDVVLAKVPCDGGKGKGGIRDVFRLQVNLVVANLAVIARGANDRMVHVVFEGSCGPMTELFRCDDLVAHEEDHWVYKPDLTRLRQKVAVPVGTCEIAPPHLLPSSGKEKYLRHTSNHKHQRTAYVTVLHSSEAYICGAIALAQSIRQTNSSKELVLLHDSSIGPDSVDGLRSAGWNTRLIRRIRSPFAKRSSYNEWNYSKLRIWELTDYDKLIFIDADILVLRNIDHFFAYPQFSASPNDGVIFNSGIMVIEPSECMFKDMMMKTSTLVPYNGGDQGFLNEIFTWWHRLPKKLNHLKIFVKESDKNRTRKHQLPDHIYAIHYLGLKPWTCYRDYDCNWDMADRQVYASDSAHRRFWDVYDAMPKQLQRYCGLTATMDARISKWRGVAKGAGFPDGHWKIRVRDPRRLRLPL